ncbi:MFS transporter [Sediminibacillus massiliensis]|uniref:MFS transporter n=1 Tax=Sediminibacillus massiliensis TaxID=1926277 RepID=UPI0009889182|nr:MFS transporter [Sediminibacillus massiliensis]
MSVLVQQNSKVKLWSKPFILLMTANALLFMVFEMLAPTLPLFVASIGGEASHIGLVTGIFMFSAIFIRPFTGMLTNHFSRKLLLNTGVVVCALSTGLYFLSSNIIVLLLIRIIHGLGFGLATTYFLTVTAERIPKDRMGEGIGYFGVGETIAISMGPIIGISILETFGFENLFLNGMAITLFALFFATFASRKTIKVKNADSNHGKQTLTVKIFEKRAAFPSLLILLVGIAVGSIISFIPLYAVEKEFQLIAWFFTITAIASFFARLISGKLYDKMGPYSVLLPFGIITLTGLLVILLGKNDVHFLIAGALYGLGFGAIFPTLQTWSLSLVKDYEHESAASSFFNSFDIGIGAGSILLGFIAEVYATYKAVYFVAIIALILYLLLTIVHCKKISVNNQIAKTSN